jgi:hypothetical protein
MQRALLLVLLALVTACTAAHKSESRAASAAENPAPAALTEAPPPANAPPPKPGAGLPDKFTNLKVLPADISKDDLGAVMREMSQGLGVKCNFCHQMAPTKDWAAETKHKEIARGMMLMTNRINQEIFTWPNAPKATCFMCHHGHDEPVLRPPLPPAGLPQGAPPPSAH